MSHATRIFLSALLIFPCLLECLVRKTGVVTNGQVNVDATVEFIQKLGDHDDDIVIAVEAVKKCVANKPLKQGTKCYVGEYFKACEHEYAKDLSFLNLLLKS